MRTSFTTLFVLSGLIASSVATPAYFRRQAATNVCSSGNPNCCGVDVLGIADLDCTTPPTIPTTVADFTSTCAGIGKEARCCDLDLLSQGLICSDPF